MAISRKLRRSSTDVERRVWSRIRSGQIEGVRFRRQHPIGIYVADFCAPSLQLVIELDGGQHAEQNERDRARSEELERRGYRVIRFWDSDAIDAIVEGIWQVVREMRG